MQFLKINEDTSLAELSNLVGSRNVDSILALNSINRAPDIGSQYFDQIDNVLQTTPNNITWQQKYTILNKLAGDAELFETASLLDETGWKILSGMDTFESYLKVPESIVLPKSVDVLGGLYQPVSSRVYGAIMRHLQATSEIDYTVFNEYSAIRPAQIQDIVRTTGSATSGVYEMFKLPWGKITLYSSLAKDSIDFPVYPEDPSTSIGANYSTMPETLYQYEPWFVYTSSGPRSNEYSFHFHRDMWTGDHRDGKAYELIQFCEACNYPEYNGSAVNSGTVTLYVNGKVLISGIMTNCRTEWSGPLGLDGWYLECKLTIAITEISDDPLNFEYVRTRDTVISPVSG